MNQSNLDRHEIILNQNESIVFNEVISLGKSSNLSTLNEVEIFRVYSRLVGILFNNVMSIGIDSNVGKNISNFFYQDPFENHNKIYRFAIHYQKNDNLTFKLQDCTNALRKPGQYKKPDWVDAKKVFTKFYLKAMFKPTPELNYYREYAQFLKENEIQST